MVTVILSQDFAWILSKIRKEDGSLNFTGRTKLQPLALLSALVSSLPSCLESSNRGRGARSELGGGGMAEHELVRSGKLGGSGGMLLRTIGEIWVR